LVIRKIKCITWEGKPGKEEKNRDGLFGRHAAVLQLASRALPQETPRAMRKNAPKQIRGTKLNFSAGGTERDLIYIYI